MCSLARAVRSEEASGYRTAPTAEETQSLHEEGIDVEAPTGERERRKKKHGRNSEKRQRAKERRARAQQDRPDEDDAGEWEETA